MATGSLPTSRGSNEVDVQKKFLSTFQRKVARQVGDKSFLPKSNARLFV